MNLNGDYISDALAAQVGGIGIAPGANGDQCALFGQPTVPRLRMQVKIKSILIIDFICSNDVEAHA